MSADEEAQDLSDDHLALLEMMLAEEDLLDLSGRFRIQPHPVDATIPLSYAQASVWFLEQMYGSNGAHNIHVAVRLQGEIDHVNLGHAINLIWQRHDALRTGFADNDGQPFQFVRPYEKFPLSVTRFSEYSLQERESRLEAKLRQESAYRFDLQQDRLARFELIEMGPQDYVVSLTMHHIIADGWSINLFMAELLQAYRALQAGQAPELPELVIQYGDYAYWQQDEGARDALKAQLDYWRQQLAPPVADVALEPKKAIADDASFVGITLAETIPKDTVSRLQMIARSQGASLFMVLLAAFKLHVAQTTGHRDIIIGSPVAGRSYAELEHLIGFFVNTLALRSHVGEKVSFTAFVDQVKQTVLDGMANQDIPFEQLVAELNPSRSYGRNPYFQLFFNMLNFENRVGKVMDLEASWLTQTELNAQFDVTVYAEEQEEGIAFALVFDKALFERRQMEHFFQGYLQLLGRVAAEPNSTIELGAGRARTTAREPVSAATPASGESIAARSDTERALLNIWQEILQLPEISMHDDFFSIGGHSLLAVRMFNQIRKRLGANLRLAVMYEHSTIASLAALIDGQAEALDDDAFVSLVKINDGRPELQPCYVVHGAGGHVIFLHEWREYLPNIPLYGFQARGFDDISEAHSSIEAMAESYVADLLQHQPEGPYYLAGYSGGGVVAFHMAQLLKKKGRETALLVLLDSFHPTVRPRQLSLYERVREVLKDPLRYIRKFYRVRIAWRITAYRNDHDENLNPDDIPIEQREVYMFDHFDSLWPQYQPEMYTGKVLMLRAQDEWIIFDHTDSSKGWLQHTQDLTIRVVPGDHRSLITPPNLAITLAVFREEFLAAQR